MSAWRLTEEQQTAVDADTHALEIRAGAGTGKTLTLAHRAARLVGGDPRLQARTLLVTFTREATASLERRMALLLGRDHHARVLSFHQWAAREIPPGERRFLPEGEARRLVRDALPASSGLQRALSVGPDEDVATRVLGVLSYCKNAQTSLHAALASTHTTLAPWQDVLERAHERYEEGKGDRLDYDDLLLAFRDRLKRSPAFRKDVAGSLHHLFVDEYQDVNGIQAETVRLVTKPGEGAPLTVVGDARQAIYGFRGASPAHLENFLRAYRGHGERVALRVSFRAARGLVEASNAALPDERPLRARAGAPRGEGVDARACEDPLDEGRAAADHAERLLAAGGDPREIVVLVRARHLAESYQIETLRRRADEAWADGDPDAMGAAIDATLRGRAPEGRAGAVLARRLRIAPPPQLDARSLLALPRGRALGEVAVSTIHAAKGLEWDHVILLGAREGGMPSEHALAAPVATQPALLAEERRLLYVALTRARISVLALWAARDGRREFAPCRWLVGVPTGRSANRTAGRNEEQAPGQATAG